MQGHWQRSKGVIAAGEHLSSGQNKDDIKSRIVTLQNKWEQLRKVYSHSKCENVLNGKISKFVNCCLDNGSS